MVSNPVIKPKVATPALILTSTAVALFAALIPTIKWPEGSSQLLSWIGLVVCAAIVGTVWLIRHRRRRAWLVDAQERWNRFEDARRTHDTTTEITVLSVDALEPTGSWITINWNRFDHVQGAWLEALPEPIWAGSVLLISPDPVQVMPGMPWPAIYYLHASQCHAWAPAKESVAPPRREPVGGR
jgi:hypothetical protein